MTRWWAFSVLDHSVHLLMSQGPSGGLTARCGHLLPPDTHRCDQPPPGPPCENCRLIFVAEFTTPRSRR